MKYHIAVKTHHKTGTNWMNNIFEGFANRVGVEYIHLSQVKDIQERKELLEQAAQGKEYKIFFHPYGRFPKVRIKNRMKFRGVHVVRDPRDMILSSAKYHQWSDEAWLHEPDEKFDGKTYQQALNELKTLDEQVLFEMNNSAAHHINMMHNFDAQNIFFNIKFEEMRRDIDLMLWHRILLRLGLEAVDLAPAMELFVQNSIQFGKLKKTSHIQDTSVLPWVRKFPKSQLPIFDEKFGKITRDLGYPATSEAMTDAKMTETA
ncbi:MAG: sulfotransferase domain-containing protein [Aquisalinus sp.]|nr:sulfotransferase domain-containing protein [Aquisalinus sp.]